MATRSKELTSSYMSGLPEVEMLTQAAKARQVEEEKNKQLVMSGLQEQLKTAEQGVTTAEQLGSIGMAQAQEAAALARQQTMGGPRGIASGASAAAAGNIAAKAAAAQRDAAALARAEKQKAREAVAITKKAVGTEQQQLLQAEKAKEQAKADALQEAKDIFQEAIDATYMFFTAGDRKDAAKQIRETILPGADPATIAAVEKFIREVVLNPNNDASWRIDAF